MNSTTLLRQLWSVIEDTQTSSLLTLNDSDLTQQLLHQVQNKYILSREELQAMHRYLGGLLVRSYRLSLIRDMSLGTRASDVKS
jgi:hypothetical protein